MAADIVLTIEGLVLRARIRQTTAEPVADAHVEVRAGEIVGLVGESGSGKTLTALSALRLLPDNVEIAAGRIEVAGQDVRTLDEAGLAGLRGSVVGMVFQDPIGSLNPSMTIGRQVAEVVRIHRRAGRAAADARAVETLGLVGFPHAHERFDAYPHQLSGGLRQRVMIAMAIANEPRLVIADEPTTALDVTVQAQILELLQSLVAELGIGVLLITHDLGVIANATDRVTVMYGGRTVEHCSTIAAFRDMRHPYTEALVASAPTLEGSAATVLRGIPGAPPEPTRPEPGCPFAPRCTRVLAGCVAAPPAFTAIGEGRALACSNPVPSVARV